MFILRRYFPFAVLCLGAMALAQACGTSESRSTPPPDAGADSSSQAGDAGHLEDAGTGDAGNGGSANAGSGNAGSGNAGSGSGQGGNAGLGNAGSGDGGSQTAHGGEAGSSAGNAGSEHGGAGGSEEPECTEPPQCLLSVRRACSDNGLVDTPCALGCSPGGCNTSCDAASVVITQSQADDHSNTLTWQSFRIPTTGTLTAVELRPNVYSPQAEPSELTLSIYAGLGLDGPLLAQEKYVLNSVSGAPAHVFTISTPPAVQGEEVYTLELTGQVSIYFANTDIYSDGRANHPTRDLYFKVHVAACH